MASVAAARRTQSSYPAFLASTNPSDLTMTVYSSGSGVAGASLTAEIARLPDVRHVDSLLVPTVVPLTSNGAPRLSTANVVVSVGSVDGMTLGQDRLAVIEGRRADQNRADQIMMTSAAASLLNVRVGQVVPLGFYTAAQMSQPGFGTPRVAPRLRVRARLVGIVTLNNELLQDDVDQAFGFTFLTPALVREVNAVSPAPITPTLYGLKLDDGGRGVAKVEQRLVGLVPPGFTYQFHVTSSVVEQMELSLKPESVSLGAFGIVAALVCLVLGLQAISRLLRSADEDRAVLRALGACPSGHGCRRADRRPRRSGPRLAARRCRGDRALTARPHRTGASRVPRSGDRPRLDGARRRVRGSGRWPRRRRSHAVVPASTPLGGPRRTRCDSPFRASAASLKPRPCQWPLSSGRVSPSNRDGAGPRCRRAPRCPAWYSRSPW